MITTELPKEMSELYKKAQELIDKSQTIKIYTHIDCDGISAGAILSTLLDRLNKPHEIEFVNLDVLDNVKLEHDLTIFSDLGSGQPVDKYATPDTNILVLDHHPPLRDINYGDDKLYEYIEINPLHHGIEGSYYVCGGGLCYFLAKEYGYKDLSWIGVLSAIGDMQNSRTGKLEGLNKSILQDAIDEGYVKLTENDINLYGRKTRPLFVALSYFSDVNLPLTNNQNETLAVLDSIGVKNKDKPLSYLTLDEKGKIFNKLVEMLSKALPPNYVEYIPKLLIGDSYDFTHEDPTSFLSDASEFSSAVNACGRNKEEKVALGILKGDRGETLDLLEAVSKEHRMNLAKAIDRIGEDGHIIELDNLQYFDGEDIKPEIVGTVAGMVLGYCNWKKPIIGFTKTDDNNLKISLRCSKLLAYAGIHFGNIIREVAQELGGTGGGHSVACGAYISADKKEEFLQNFNERIDGLIDK